MSTLPAELVDVVIDFLQQDRGALRTCALVAKTWVPRSQAWLFRAIQVGPDRQECLDGALPLGPHFSVMLLPRFVDCVRSARHLLANLVDLRVLGSDELRTDRGEWEYICANLHTSSRIRRLHIDAPGPGELTFLMNGLRPRIVSLAVFSFSIPTWGPALLGNVLRLYPELRTIFAEPDYASDPVDVPHYSLAPSDDSPGRTFVLYWNDVVNADGWWRRLLERDKVYLRETPSLDARELFAATLAAAKVATVVRGLEVDTYECSAPSFAPLLRSFARLRVLHLVFYEKLRGDPFPEIVSLIHGIKGACTRLRALAVEILVRGDRSSNMGKQDWPALDTCLAEPAWVDLQLHVRICVALTLPSVGPDMRRVVSAGLPRAMARRKVHCTCLESETARYPTGETFAHLLADDY